MFAFTAITLLILFFLFLNFVLQIVFCQFEMTNTNT